MIKVYGASDDLIEVEGDIREEFQHYQDDETYLSFSDGTILEVVYGKRGLWRIHTLNAGEGSRVRTEPAKLDEPEKYSDTATIESASPIRYVVVGNQIASRFTNGFVG